MGTLKSAKKAAQVLADEATVRIDCGLKTQMGKGKTRHVYPKAERCGKG